MGYYDGYGQGGGFLASIPPVVKNILIINVLFFIATMVNEEFMLTNFAMFFPASHFFRLWQPLTHMFMHGGFWHIFFNMYSLFIFGCVLERTIGSKKFFTFYFITGLGAVALHTFVQFLQAKVLLANGATGAYYALCGTPTVGASGAIYGVLIGYAMMYPNSVLTLIFPPVSLKAKWFVLIFAAIELFTGVTGTMDGVAHFAHLGGMLFGWLLLLYWQRSGALYDPDRWI